MKQVTYKKAILTDAEQIYRLVQNTIQTIYPDYYPREIVNFFCSLHNKENITKDIESGCVGILMNHTDIIGTGSFKDNHITRVYVGPAFQENGYGSYIMRHLENKIALKYDFACLDASLPAERFYKYIGYKTIKENNCTVNNGIILRYKIMEKQLKQ